MWVLDGIIRECWIVGVCNRASLLELHAALGHGKDEVYFATQYYAARRGAGRSGGVIDVVLTRAASEALRRASS